MVEYTQNEKPEGELKLTEIFWQLLAQWKAILIIALVFAIALPGFKLLKDMREYRSAVDNATANSNVASENVSEAPAESRVEELLETLSGNDRIAVEYLSQQQQLAQEQYEYLTESIWLTSDPANQRTLSTQYYLLREGEGDLQPIIDAYSVCLKRPKVTAEIGRVVAPETDIKYINELVTITGSLVPDSQASGAILTVDIVLPKEAESSMVSALIDSIMNDVCSELRTAIGEHTVSRLSSEEQYRYNTSAIDRRQIINNNINGLQSNIKTQRASLSDPQKSVLNEITDILAEEDKTDKGNAASNSSEVGSEEAVANIAKPSFSKKLTVLGFAGGVFLYAFAYLVLVVTRGRVSSLGELEPFVCGRSLGQIRWHGQYDGLSKLLHSKAVENLRWRSCGPIESQIERTVSTIDSTCKNSDVHELSILTMLNDATGEQVASEIAGMANQAGISTTCLSANGDIDENMFLTLSNAILMAERGAKCSDVWKVTELCQAYGVDMLGSVFIGEM